MAAAKNSPIFSTLAEDPKAGDAIDAFVVGLAERVDDLQDCEARSDHDGLAAQAGRLAQDAERVGYDLLAATARAVLRAAGDRCVEDAHKAVVELTEISQRVRLGHRGAL
jgi:hypothetical protein